MDLLFLHRRIIEYTGRNFIYVLLYFNFDLRLFCLNRMLVVNTVLVIISQFCISPFNNFVRPGIVLNSWSLYWRTNCIMYVWHVCRSLWSFTIYTWLRRVPDLMARLTQNFALVYCILMNWWIDSMDTCLEFMVISSKDLCVLPLLGNINIIVIFLEVFVR